MRNQIRQYKVHNKQPFFSGTTNRGNYRNILLLQSPLKMVGKFAMYNYI